MCHFDILLWRDHQLFYSPRSARARREDSLASQTTYKVAVRSPAASSQAQAHSFFWVSVRACESPSWQSLMLQSPTLQVLPQLLQVLRILLSHLLPVPLLLPPRPPYLAPSAPAQSVTPPHPNTHAPAAQRTPAPCPAPPRTNLLRAAPANATGRNTCR